MMGCRKSRKYTFTINGEEHTIKDLSQTVGIPIGTIRYHMSKGFITEGTEYCGLLIEKIASPNENEENNKQHKKRKYTIDKLMEMDQQSWE